MPKVTVELDSNDCAFLCGLLQGNENVPEDWAEHIIEALSKPLMPKSRGLSFKIKKDKEKEWADFVKKNSKSAYEAFIVESTKIVGHYLDQGKTPEQSLDKINDLGLTSFQIGCVAATIAKFHQQGEEFRRWWNIKYQLKNEGEEANKKGGILNPAILKIKL